MLRELFTPDVIKYIQYAMIAGGFIGTCFGAYMAKRGFRKEIEPIKQEVTETENGSMKGMVKRSEADIGAVRSEVRSLHDRMSGMEDRMSGVDDRLTSIEGRFTGVERNVSLITEVVMKSR